MAWTIEVFLEAVTENEELIVSLESSPWENGLGKTVRVLMEKKLGEGMGKIFPLSVFQIAQEWANCINEPVRLCIDTDAGREGVKTFKPVRDERTPEPLNLSVNPPLQWEKVDEWTQVAQVVLEESSFWPVQCLHRDHSAKIWRIIQTPNGFTRLKGMCEGHEALQKIWDIVPYLQNLQENFDRTVGRIVDMILPKNKRCRAKMLALMSFPPSEEEAAEKLRWRLYGLSLECEWEGWEEEHLKDALLKPYGGENVFIAAYGWVIRKYALKDKTTVGEVRNLFPNP